MGADCAALQAGKYPKTTTLEIPYGRGAASWIENASAPQTGASSSTAISG